MTARMLTPFKTLLPLLAALSLTACGGWMDDEDTAAGETTSGGTTAASGTGKLTLSSSSPATHDGTVDLATAEFQENAAAAADAAIAVPYCALRFERVAHSGNANKYYVAVYFRQSDAKVLNASIFSPTATWAAGHFDAAAGIAGVTVDVAKRTVTFTDKTLTDVAAPSNKTTVNGSFVFPAGTVAACGA